MLYLKVFNFCQLGKPPIKISYNLSQMCKIHVAHFSLTKYSLYTHQIYIINNAENDVI